MHATARIHGDDPLDQFRRLAAIGARIHAQAAAERGAAAWLRVPADPVSSEWIEPGSGGSTEWAGDIANYATINTSVLGLAIEGATQTPLADQVRDLVRDYARLLDVPVLFCPPGGEPVRLTEPQAPWEVVHADPAARREALLDYGATLRSQYPHARILSIDTSKARALAGVHAVLTADDVPGENIHGLVHLDWPVLCAIGDKARYMGDAIAIVAADTQDIAEAALDLIAVEYEPLPVVGDPVYARTPEAPHVHEGREGGNMLKHIKVRHGDLEAGFAQADVIIERTFHTPTIEHAFLEPECSIRVPAGNCSAQRWAARLLKPIVGSSFHPAHTSLIP